MNENNQYNNQNVRPYKATGNLNTVIANPSMDVNDTMNVNIQSMATNHVPASNNQELGIGTVDSSMRNFDNQDQINTTSMPISDTANNINNQNSTIHNQVNTNNSQSVNNQSSYVNRTYVTTDMKPKKKNTHLNLGPEFKMAFLIIVILLVFVFLLPMISDMLGGY